MSSPVLEPLSTEELRVLRDRLAVAVPGLDEAERVNRIRLLEEIKAASAAGQAVEIAAFGDAARQMNLDCGEAGERADRGVGSQVALAVRTSPYRGRRFLGWSRILTRELPCTFAELAAGRTTEWRAILVARETAWLSREHRAQVDRELAPQLEQWGDRQVEAQTRRAAYRLDPAGAADRLRSVIDERRVTMRPAPDTMVRLSALLPVACGVAAWAALHAHANAVIGTGDPRGQGQIMADTLVERVTGQAAAQAVPVEIELVMTAEALLGEAGEPGEVVGYGPVPASWARDLALSEAGPRWLRRLYTDPVSGRLAGLDSRRRLFSEQQRRFVRLRDQHCRTPWCDAPIRHTDHITPWQHGGPTSVANAKGVCVGCNHAKQAPGWTDTTETDGSVETSTPTGHRYRSREPALPGAPPGTSFITRHDPRVVHITWFGGHAA